MQEDQAPTTPALIRTFALLATMLLGCATAFDLGGRAFDIPLLWRWGGHLLVLGIVVSSAHWLVSIFVMKGKRRGIMLWFAALCCYALARWVRGSASVPPDPPLQALEIIGLILLIIALWRSRSERRESS